MGGDRLGLAAQLWWAILADQTVAMRYQLGYLPGIFLVAVDVTGTAIIPVIGTAKFTGDDMAVLPFLVGQDRLATVDAYCAVAG